MKKDFSWPRLGDSLKHGLKTPDRTTSRALLPPIGQRGDVMTKTQAAALRAKEPASRSLPWQHLHVELESSDDGYWMGHDHCMVCGEAGACTPHASVSHEPTTSRERIRLLPKGKK